MSALSGARSPAPAAGDHEGFLNYYCGKCHNATDWAGGVAFDTMTFDDVTGLAFSAGDGSGDM